MSFLIQEPTRQRNSQSGGRSRARNNNASARSIVGDNFRIFPGLENRKHSQQQTSGNQIMLQRQKPRSTTNKLQKQQKQKQHQQERPNQQHQEQVTTQEHENLGDYTMERVMQDLRILEQQQRDAKEKLVSAQNTKQKQLDRQRQLNTQLENKNYSNGTLRAKLRQSHDFLSDATRELGNRKLTTGQLQDGISDFECKLKRGLQSRNLIQICVAKIDFFLIIIEHGIANMSRLRMEKMQIVADIRQTYEQTEHQDRMLRLAIQDVQKRARKWSEEKGSLRTQAIKLDNDKTVAQNTEQTAELQIQCAYDQIKSEADRVVSLKRTLVNAIKEATLQRKTVSSKITAGSTSLEALRFEVEGHQKKIIECRKVEGQPQARGGSPVFDQALFRGDLTRLEEQAQKDEDEFFKSRKIVEDTETAVEFSKEKTLRNDKEASILIDSANCLIGKEEKRQKHAAEFHASLQHARAEVAKLEESFREMEETRCSDARANLNALSDNDVETKEQIKLVEDVELKIKFEDTSLKTKIRLFEDNQKLPLLKRLEGVKDKSLSEEKKYQSLVDFSSVASIESKLQEEFQHKVDDETTRFERKNKNLISRCDKHLRNFPCLQKIDYIFSKDKDRDEQIKAALGNMERDCTARKITAKASKDQKVLARQERNKEVEAMRAKLKEKEEAQSKLAGRHFRKKSHHRVTKGRQFDEKSNRRVSDAPFHGDDGHDAVISSHTNGAIERRKHRRRKGSDFFNPRAEDNNGMSNELTPTQPRKLMSSFLSQSSGQRVRWVDKSIGGNDGKDSVNDDSNEEHVESRSKERNPSDSFDRRKNKSKGLVGIDSAFAKTPTTANTKEQKAQTSEFDVKFLEGKKQASGIESSLPGGRRRRRSASKSLRNKSLKWDSQSSRHLEEYEKELAREKKVVDDSASNSSSIKRKFHSNDSGTQDTIDKEKFEGSHRRSRNCLSTLDSNIDDVSSNSLKTSSCHMRKEKAKRRRKSVVRDNDRTPLRDGLHKAKRRSSSSSSRSYDKDASKRGHCSSNDLIQNIDSAQVNHTRANHDKGKQLEKSNVTFGGRPPEQGVQKESRTKHAERRSSGQRGKSSLLHGKKESNDKARKISKSNVMESCEKTYDKSPSSRAINKDSRGKAHGKNRSPSRKRLSAGKKIHGKGREPSNGVLDMNKTSGGEDTATHNSSNTKASSSSLGNRHIKKRKMKSDNVSVASSRTSVTARRRKKRNTGLSQRSTTMDIRDESCDFNFQ